MDCPYEERFSDLLGRYLVASRDFKPREVIISEEPLITGPLDEQFEQGNVPVCLGCCLNQTENQFSRCSKCRFPLCSETCEQATAHIENECEVFTKNKVLYPPPYPLHILYKSILILRCFLLKEKNPEKWEKLMSMSDNKSSRRNRPNCITADERILENFRKFLPGENSFDVEEILKISGILDVNAHSFPVKVDGKVVASKCHIYYKICLIAHSCSPNSSWAVDKSSDSGLVVKTNVFVAKGEMISVAYDDSNLLYSTLKRLIPMEMSGMFICMCIRCKDPTELNTYLAALKCHNCPEGYVLSLNPTNSFSDWRCDSCAKIVNEIDVSEIIDEVETAVGFTGNILSTEVETDVDILKEYVREFSKNILHPNHYIIQEINLRIIRSVCYELDELSDENLQEFLDRCENLLEISDVLTPGFCEYRAFLLYHYFHGLLEFQSRRKCNSTDSSSVTEKDSSLRNDIDNSSVKFTSSDFLKTYEKILRMQQEVYGFLEEKFTSSGKRIDYVREKIEFVKGKIEQLKQNTTK